MKVPKVSEDSPESSFRFFEFFLLFLICLVFAGVLTIYNNIYKHHQNNGFERALTELLPLPAGTVNGEWVAYNDVFKLDQMAQVEYPDDDHFSYAFDAAVREILLQQLATELGVFYKPTEPDAGAEDYIIYGWDKEDYQSHVLEPLALSSLLQEAVLSCQSCQQDVFMEMEHVASLLGDGIAFSDIAIQYSQVASAQFGGDIGWMEYEDLDQDLLELWDYEVGQRSGIIELDNSFVIARVYDVFEAEEGRDSIAVQMIVLYKNELSEVLLQKKETSEIKMF